LNRAGARISRGPFFVPGTYDVVSLTYRDRPDLFASVASFSGAVDLGDMSTRTVITEQAVQYGQKNCAICPCFQQYVVPKSFSV
jgi:hypothetical protein